MKKKYFGTDGIRGKVNNSRINGEMFFKFGLAAGTYFKNLEISQIKNQLKLDPKKRNIFLFSDFLRTFLNF